MHPLETIDLQCWVNRCLHIQTALFPASSTLKKHTFSLKCFWGCSVQYFVPFHGMCIIYEEHCHLLSLHLRAHILRLVATLCPYGSEWNGHWSRKDIQIWQRIIHGHGQALLRNRIDWYFRCCCSYAYDNECWWGFQLSLIKKMCPWRVYLPFYMSITWQWPTHVLLQCRAHLPVQWNWYNCSSIDEMQFSKIICSRTGNYAILT